MSSYEITFYSRSDITFGRDANGEFTVTVKEGATPETIKIVDNDKGAAGNTFSGNIRAGHTGQHAYGETNGHELNGDPIQPVAALPGAENPDDQIMAICIGSPSHTVGYGFTYEPVPGETMTFNYNGYIRAPSYESDSLYVEGGQEPPESSSSSGTSGASGASGATSASSSPSSGGEGASGGASGGGSGPSGGGKGGSGASGGSSGPSGGGKGGSGASGGSSGPSGGGKGGSGASGGSSGPSGGGSGPSGGGSGPSEPPCFTRGTAIRTARGDVLVEALVPGDHIWTEAHGFQPVRWICQREVPAKGAFAPIRIRAGALGATRDILVSPAHRMLVQGPQIELIFGEQKALVAAKDLVNGHSIIHDTSMETIEYFHILFDRHEVLEAHGTLSESFYPHGAAMEDFGADQRKELFALFPELEFGTGEYAIAYPALMPHEAVLLGL